MEADKRLKLDLRITAFILFVRSGRSEVPFGRHNLAIPVSGVKMISESIPLFVLPRLY